MIKIKQGRTIADFIHEHSIASKSWEEKRGFSDGIEKAGIVISCPQTDSILLVEGERNGHWWSLPKGHIKKGEGIVACAVRETKEETGLDIDSSSLFARPIKILTTLYFVYDVSATHLRLPCNCMKNVKRFRTREVAKVEWIPLKHCISNSIRMNTELRRFIKYFFCVKNMTNNKIVVDDEKDNKLVASDDKVLIGGDKVPTGGNKNLSGDKVVVSSDDKGKSNVDNYNYGSSIDWRSLFETMASHGLVFYKPAVDAMAEAMSGNKSITIDQTIYVLSLPKLF